MKNTWIISSLELILDDGTNENIINKVNWCYVKEHEGFNVDESGTYKLPPASVENFIPLNNIAKENIIDWLEQEIDMIEMNTRLELTLNELIAPTIIIHIPNWE